jgi:bifunctional ADP-heptose synthase (sugar kinase/adenylyltransferase)
MTRSELSRETPHFPLPIVEERASPGGAGNTAANLAALRPASVRMLGVLGNDWRGGLLLDALTSRGVEIGNLLLSKERVTHAYAKPLRKGRADVVYEDPRLDFENLSPMPEALENVLIASLHAAAPSLDALCVCDQFAFGCVTARWKPWARPGCR